VGLARPHDYFVAEYKTWWNKGFRLKTLTADVVNGQVLYNGVWNPSTAGQYLRLSRTHDDFLAENSVREKEGFRLAALGSHVWNGVVIYGGVWNPSTTGQSLSLNHPQPEFEAKNTQRAAEGWRLAAMIGDHVEALDIGQMGETISNGLAGKCVGYSATVGAGGARVRVAGGLRRTATDAPARASSTSARMNVASVAKPITAVAVHQLLAAKRRPITKKIHTYLPSDWTLGPNVDTITFQELLTHRSGFRDDQPETYENLKKKIAKGINLADKSKTCEGKPSGSCYANTNFALFRIIIPYLTGYVAPATNKATDVSNAYLAYMNQKVFAPAGIATVELKPAATEPTLAYPFPAGSVKGIHFGDWTDQAGGAGYHLSADDLASFLVKLRDGTLLSAHSQWRMDTNMLGWGDRDPVRHGFAFSHGGGFPLQPGALNTLVMSVTSGASLSGPALDNLHEPIVQVGIEVNSQTNVDLRLLAIDAFNSSWVNVR
jgi:CubicO group peptidase (beta-lactamase class C family)